jgi:hypothetical protein
VTPEALLAVMVLTWVGLLAGLWRIAARVEQIDRLMLRLDERSTAFPGDRRG